MSQFSLADKVILATGGVRGLGAASVRAFVGAGAKVVVLDLDRGEDDQFWSDLGSSASFLEHDVSRPESWQRVLDSVLGTYGKVDGLLNNAAIFDVGGIADTSPDTFDRFYEVNQRGVFLGMRAVLAPMREAGGGVIINLSSATGRRGIPGMIGYSSTKWAVRGMTRCAASEFAPFNIRVNSVCPGQIDTRMLAMHSEEMKAQILAMIPLGRFGEPRDVGNLMRFLMSDEASYLSGAEFTIDGAMLA